MTADLYSTPYMRLDACSLGWVNWIWLSMAVQGIDHLARVNVLFINKGVKMQD